MPLGYIYKICQVLRSSHGNFEVHYSALNFVLSSEILFVPVIGHLYTISPYLYCVFLTKVVQNQSLHGDCTVCVFVLR